jgi:hypothetical protein
LVDHFRFRVICVFLTIVALPATVIPADEISRTVTGSQQPSVSDLTKSEFKRVPGDAYGGSVLDIGEPNSWFRVYVATPTIDFDGNTYRMWFVGGAHTQDSSVPYGFTEEIGMAVSTDGIHWKVANESRPVLSVGSADSADAKGLAHPSVLRVKWAV